LEEAEFCNNIILIDAGKLIAEGNPKQLKSEYLKNSIYEIESDKVIEALELFEKQDFVVETSIFGNNIHISVEEKFNNLILINKICEENGITIKRINKIVPTLEDVFIHLLGSEKKS